MAQEDDIWYAAKIMKIIKQPNSTLETFGTTNLRYYMVSELLDEVDRVRVRTGTVHAERPQIITPAHFAQQILDGFGEKAKEYADWLEDQGQLVKVLQYGLQIRKEGISSEIVSGNVDEVINKVKVTDDQQEDSHSVILFGADELWEVSLLSFLHQYIEKSSSRNILDIQQREDESKKELEREIEMEFKMAKFSKTNATRLGNKLQRYGLFEKYQDRFLDLFK
ncbi:MAG: hypothetical protein MK193_00660 [Lentisphaeria bacterium]|nr:hypothetical protein [Lentisphaeria bacterium]